MERLKNSVSNVLFMGLITNLKNAGKFIMGLSSVGLFITSGPLLLTRIFGIPLEYDNYMSMGIATVFGIIGVLYLIPNIKKGCCHVKDFVTVTKRVKRLETHFFDILPVIEMMVAGDIPKSKKEEHINKIKEIHKCKPKD